MKYCVWTDVGTWTNWLTFGPDPDYTLDAGAELLSLISYALQRRILLRREYPTYRYWAPVAAATRGFKMVLFTASRGNTFVGGTCALPSALRLFIRMQLVWNVLPCMDNWTLRRWGGRYSYADSQLYLKLLRKQKLSYPKQIARNLCI